MRNTRLSMYITSVLAVASGRENPCEALRLTAQPASKRIARARYRYVIARLRVGGRPAYRATRATPDSGRVHAGARATVNPVGWRRWRRHRETAHAPQHENDGRVRPHLPRV